MPARTHLPLDLDLRYSSEDYETADQVRGLLHKHTEEPEWHRFDICAAYWRFCLKYHPGQWSPEYRALSWLSRNYETWDKGRGRKETLTDNAFLIFLRLVLGSLTGGLEGTQVRVSRAS